MIMVRNPWGNDNSYNQTWKATSTKWIASNIAQVPLGVNPTLSQTPDGVIIMPVTLMQTCFRAYDISHLRDGDGFVRTWYDVENSADGTTSFTFSPYAVVDVVYVSVENYPLNLVPGACLLNGNAA
jgi:hypothetical protein